MATQRRTFSHQCDCDTIYSEDLAAPRPPPTPSRQHDYLQSFKHIELFWFEVIARIVFGIYAFDPDFTVQSSRQDFRNRLQQLCDHHISYVHAYSLPIAERISLVWLHLHLQELLDLRSLYIHQSNSLDHITRTRNNVLQALHHSLAILKQLRDLAYGHRGRFEGDLNLWKVFRRSIDDCVGPNRIGCDLALI